MKTQPRLSSSALCVALFALCIVHSALCIAAAEPPPAAAQEGVRLWEGGPFWADRNVGAEEPWEAGLYFWWGDTVGCRRENDKWAASDGSTNDFRFSFGNPSPFRLSAADLARKGWTTTNNVLAPEHDAARANWGGEWRMPTKPELLDLAYNKCDWTFVETNGVKAAVVRGRGDYASACILLPVDGWAVADKIERWNHLGHMWASDPRTDGLHGSWRLKYGTSGKVVFYHWDRFVGTTVRAVRGNPGPFPGHGTEIFQEDKANTVKPAGPACAPEELFVPAAGEPAAQKGVRLWEGGPLWADRNVGAETPTDDGWYFPWGDTIGYTYDPEAKCWVAVDGSDPRHGFDEAPKNSPAFGKSPATLLREGFTTAEGALAPEHDAARAKWGGEWRMPTRQELDDLCYNKCDWTWTTNGVKGFVVRGRGDYADAAIFLPAAGHGLGIVRRGYGSSSCLYASEPYADGQPEDCTWRLRFSWEKRSPEIGMNHCWDRYIAAPVRPVKDE